MNKIKNKLKVNNLNSSFVISIIGNVNHGKTTLFSELLGKDWVKNETNNITQTIYFDTKKPLVLLDTPGHNDFHYIRKDIFPITNLVILIISITKINSKEIQYLIKEIKENINFDKIMILLTFCDNIKESIVLNKLSTFNIMPNYLGGDYELYVYKNENFIYENFENLRFLNKDKLFEYLCQLHEIYNTSDLNIDSNKFLILNKEFDKTMGLVYSAVLLSGNNIFKKDYIINTNVQILKLFSSDKKIINNSSEVPEKIYIKTDKELLINKIYSTSQQKQYHSLEYKSTKSPIVNEKNIQIFVLYEDEKKFLSIKNFAFKENINLFSNLGKLNSLDEMLIKEKKMPLLLYGDNLSLTTKNNIFKTSSYFEMIEEILRLKNDFEKEKYFFELIKENKAIAKIKKVFNIDNKVIYGCDLIKGKLLSSYKACVLRNNKIIFDKQDIQSLKIKDLDVISVLKDQEFGIIINVDCLKGDTIIFIDNDINSR